MIDQIFFLIVKAQQYSIESLLCSVSYVSLNLNYPPSANKSLN